MFQRAQRGTTLTFTVILSALAQAAHAQHANTDAPAATSPPAAAPVAPIAPTFGYAAACESKAEFLTRLAALSGDADAEQALARRSVDVSIVEVEPDQWTLTVQRNTAAGTQGRVLRDKSCEQLATAARVVLSVWLREESELPPSAPAQAAPIPPPPQPAPPPTPAEPSLAAAESAATSSEDRYFKRFFGISALVETSSSYYAGPAGGVTGELWTMLEELRLSVALSYWTSLREWTGQSSPTQRVQGWDATGQAGIFLFHTPELDLGVMGALSVGYARVDELAAGVQLREKHFYIRPTAAGVLLWSFARPLRLRAMVGLTQLERSSSDDTEFPALYAAAGLDFEI